MRAIHLMLALSIAAVAMPAAIYAGTRIRPIHQERLKLLPAARHDEVLADLKAVLSGPAWPTAIATRAYPSPMEPTLCRRDVVGISYVPVGEGPDAPLKPEGISGVTEQYYFLGEDAPKSIEARRKACASHSDNEVQWFLSYEGDHFTASALTMLPGAIDDVRRGRDVALSCEDVQVECDAKLFLKLTPHAATVWRCQGKVENCYGYEMGGYNVTITFEYPGNSRRTLIKIEPLPIVVT